MHTSEIDIKMQRTADKAIRKIFQFNHANSLFTAIGNFFAEGFYVYSSLFSN